jgi:CarboxypepD_reg-like domain
MRKLISILLLLIPVTVIAQFKITGKILDSADKKSVPGATVFLANASVGTATAVDGTFTLDNVHGGQYELVVTMVGYTTYRKTILVNDNINLPDISLSSKSIALNEVKIRPDPDWAAHYEAFRKEFLGYSDYTAKCKILNPELINFQVDEKTGTLTASSSDFIVIENKALGYKVKYMLQDFSKDYNNGILYFAGTAFFEELPGKDSQKKNWAKNRLKVYDGSSMHFLRSVIANRVSQEGFGVLRLIRQTDSTKNKGSKQYFENLVATPPLTILDFLRLTDSKGLYALTFNNCLYIKHSDKAITSSDDILNASGPQTTIIFDKSYAFFDNNGIFTDPSAIIFEGGWGVSRMAEMLPVDYEPGK